MLEGRRFWFVGIGGAGMSALALVARAWGAEVGGSDRARSSYVDRLEEAGIPVTIGHDYGTTVEIMSGLEPTDQVIVAPSDSLTSGTRVRIAHPPAGAQR